MHRSQRGPRSLVDFGLREGLVNGDFEKNGSGGSDVPGWSFHGGGGTASVHEPFFGNSYLKLNAGEFRLHNRFYLPSGTAGIGYCWVVEETGDPEFLRVVLTSPEGDDLVHEVGVSGTTGWACAAGSVDSSHWGKIRQLRIEVVGSNPSSTVEVGVDYVGLGFGAPCSYSLDPTSRVHDSSPAVDQQVHIDTASGCSWTAVSNESWIQVADGTAGDGSGRSIWRQLNKCW